MSNSVLVTTSMVFAANLLFFVGCGELHDEKIHQHVEVSNELNALVCQTADIINSMAEHSNPLMFRERVDEVAFEYHRIIERVEALPHLDDQQLAFCNEIARRESSDAGALLGSALKKLSSVHRKSEYCKEVETLFSTLLRKSCQ